MMHTKRKDESRHIEMVELVVGRLLCTSVLHKQHRWSEKRGLKMVSMIEVLIFDVLPPCPQSAPQVCIPSDDK